jgi:hypothetical protein
MMPVTISADRQHYARCIKASRKVRWDIDADVVRGRELDAAQKYLPDGLSLVHEMPSLSFEEQRLMSRIQGRTYANMFGLVERYIGAKILELTGDYTLGDQVALEALVRFSDEELKHQELFRRIEAMAARAMAPGYVFCPDPNDVARVVLSKSTWAVLALTCHIELFTQAHYRQSLDEDATVSDLYRDVFKFHWKEECQHAVLDELEWRREDARLSADERNAAVDDLIGLVSAVDGIVQMQAAADARYFATVCGRTVDSGERARIEAGVLRAYRWQYIVSGVQHPRFSAVLQELVTPEQLGRIGAALAPIM